MKITTREQWLHAIVDAARPMFEALERPLPAQVRVAVCPPARKVKAVGVCWHSVCSEDGVREIWVDATLNDPLRICDVLVHELCHAALPDDTGHKAPFAKLAAAMHLEGKPTATYGGEDFARVWQPILDDIGAYPGGKLKLPERKSKSYNNVKIDCFKCEGLFYTSISRADGVKCCPFCASDQLRFR